LTEDWLGKYLEKSGEEISFPEYDESVADGVEVCVCPTCGHEHTKK